ncbi:hypothetical protein BJX66DRAFT_106636 [Aspergillus keveii]|uniref:Uncharacterized protein n=1 Tax=Aspergillus keveii TaxID=714993 RepID=A0ABR4GPM2_9EURO
MLFPSLATGSFLFLPVVENCARKSSKLRLVAYSSGRIQSPAQLRHFTRLKGGIFKPKRQNLFRLRASFAALLTAYRDAPLCLDWANASYPPLTIRGLIQSQIGGIHSTSGSPALAACAGRGQSPGQVSE